MTMDNHLKSLPLLQKRIKTDPQCYAEEFFLQYKHFHSVLQILESSPHKIEKSISELILFIAQTVPHYPSHVTSVFNSLTFFLDLPFDAVNPETRLTLIKAVFSLRSQKVVSLLKLLPIFFNLLEVPDKHQRKILMNYIIRDIVSNKLFQCSEKRELKQLFLNELKQKSTVRRLRNVNRLVIELFRRNIWRDASLVQCLVNVLLSLDSTQLSTIISNFLLGHYTRLTNNDSDSSDADDEKEKKRRHLIIGAKKTRGRINRLERQEQMEKRKLARRQMYRDDHNFTGGLVLDLVYDPQTLAERLLMRVTRQTRKDPFALRLLFLNIISRLIGRYQLIVLPFYTTLQRFINSRQTQITKILAILAQGCHELVPPQELQPLVRCIMDEFVAEYQTPEAIALGLHAIRQICERAPLSLSEEILADLCRFHRYKNQLVVSASRSLINLYRDIYPALLGRHLRGKSSAIEVAHNKDCRLEYGVVSAETNLKGLPLRIDTVTEQCSKFSKSDETTNSEGEETFQECGSLLTTSEEEDLCLSSDSKGKEYIKKEKEEDEEKENEEEEDEEEEDEEEEDEEEEDEEEEDEEEEDEEEEKLSSITRVYARPGHYTMTSIAEKKKKKKNLPNNDPLNDILDQERHKGLPKHIQRNEFLCFKKSLGQNYHKIEMSSEESEDSLRQDFDVVDPNNFVVRKCKKGREYRLAKLRESKENQLSFTERARLRHKSIKGSTPNSVKKRNKPLMMVKHKRSLMARRQEDVASKITRLRNHIKTLRTSTGKKRKYRRG